MSHSWLYDRKEQLDGYKAFARIAYTLRRHVLPDDRNDIEMDIILKLKAVSDKRNGQITPTSLWFVGRCMKPTTGNGRAGREQGSLKSAPAIEETWYRIGGNISVIALTTRPNWIPKSF